MANPVTIYDRFDLGVKSDVAETELPRGAWLAALNLLPNIGGFPVGKRGAWSYASAEFAGAASTVGPMVYAPGYADALHVVNVSGVHEIHSVNLTTGTVTDRNVAGNSNQNINDIALFAGTPMLACSTGVTTYDGSYTKTDHAGSPGTDAIAAFQGRAWAGGSGNRLYYSAPGDFTAWDTTDPGGQWLDTTYGISALIPVRGRLLIFGEDGIEWFAGDPDLDTDQLRFFHSEGAAARAHVFATEDEVYWLNDNGVYVTDGVSVENLVQRAGYSRGWRNVAAGGTFNGIGVLDEWVFAFYSTSDCLAINRETRSVWTISNMPFGWCVGASVGEGELYAAMTNDDRVAAVSGIWTPGSKADGNGTNISASGTLPFVPLSGFARGRLEKLWLTHLLTDNATDNPTLTPTVRLERQGASNVALTALAENSETTREPVYIREKGSGLELDVVVTAAAGVFYLHQVELEAHVYERSRRA